MHLLLLYSYVSNIGTFIHFISLPPSFMQLMYMLSLSFPFLPLFLLLFLYLNLIFPFPFLLFLLNFPISSIFIFYASCSYALMLLCLYHIKFLLFISLPPSFKLAIFIFCLLSFPKLPRQSNFHINRNKIHRTHLSKLNSRASLASAPLLPSPSF